jgi:ubiquinone/menaquinone biosynthesis C-methylase UbiE
VSARAPDTLKDEVQRYWNAHPCGTQFTELPWGSKEFFEAVENFRYHTQPFMHELVGFDRYRGKRVLEVGCGLGTDLLQFARGGAIVTGIDLSSTSIELVKRRFALYGLSVDARTADAEQLPFDENSFDLVYSFGVLHHTPNTQKAIDEVYRVLKPGGECTIMLYHKHSLHVWLGAVWHWLHAAERARRSIVEDWVRVYDGEGNPLGKAYSRSDARRMFGKFTNLRITLCDPIRRKLPTALNILNQYFFARWAGFWMVVHARKPLADR